MTPLAVPLDKCISTHALTEGDEAEVQQGTGYNISTHALTEGDPLPG